MGRDYPSSFSFSFANVSIHAPAWGATILNNSPHLSHRRFNPRARMGRDPSTVTVALAA